MFDAVEDVEGAINVFGLVLAKVEVDGVKDVVESDGAVESGKEEPCAEVVAGDVVGDS